MFDLLLLHFCGLQYKARSCRSRFGFYFFFFFCSWLLGLWRISKRLGFLWLGQGLQCPGNGRALNFACRADAKKAKNVGQTKAVKIDFWTKLPLPHQTPVFTFWRRRKVTWFAGMPANQVRKERSRHEMVGAVFNIGLVPGEETVRGREKKVWKDRAPVYWHFRRCWRKSWMRKEEICSISRYSQIRVLAHWPCPKQEMFCPLVLQLFLRLQQTSVWRPIT